MRTALLIMLFVLVAGRAAAAERIMLIGDSQAFLLKEELGLHARAAGHQFASVPIAGSTLIQWATPKTDRWDIRRERQLVRQFHPTVLLVSLGSNDAYMGERVIRNEPPYLDRLQRWFVSLDARVVWLTPPHLVKAVKGLELFVQMIKQNGQVVLDGRACPVTYWSDRLHPDQPGQQRWADWIWKGLVDGHLLE